MPAAAGGTKALPVVLSTRRLDGIGPVDPLSGQLTAGAGATLGDVRRHAVDHGWVYGVDLAARDSATIGGKAASWSGEPTVATNTATSSRQVRPGPQEVGAE